MRQIDPILNRIKQVLRVTTDVEMTEKWGVKYATLDTWKNRDSIPQKRLKEFSQNEGVSLDWLLYGVDNNIKKQKVNVKGNKNQTTTINGNININTSQFDNSKDIEEIIGLLQYAPSEFIATVKEKLKKYKEITLL